MLTPKGEGKPLPPMPEQPAAPQQPAAQPEQQQPKPQGQPTQKQMDFSAGPGDDLPF